MGVFAEGHIETREGFVATIGFFDGVHRGHQYLISQLHDLAKSTSLGSMVITFAKHPRLVVQPQAQVSLLTSNEQKSALLQEQGIDKTVFLDFTPEMSMMTAYQFMLYLYEEWQVRVLLIGYDHRFGHNRSEGFEDYVRYGQEMGMKVVQAKEERISEEQGVSSSEVRQFILEGEMDKASQCLGRYYDFTGKVVSGYHKGLKLGFPTANLELDIPNRLLPPVGVYVVWASLGEHTYKAMLNIGYRPTVSFDGKISLEVHLLHFNREIYGETMHVSVVHRLRNEVKFSSPEQLVEQLQRDAHAVEMCLK